MATSLSTPATSSSWSHAWLEALAAFSHPGRLRRGQQFADRRRIRRLEIRPGEINADVRDGDQTYHVVIHIPVFDDATWEAVVRRLASQALYSARLLAGEMPPEVVEVFAEVGVTLFPVAADPETEPLQATCTCPDWEVPCKHTAAVYYLLAERFDEDPFLLFLVRGRSKEQLLPMLRRYRQVETAEPVSMPVPEFKVVPLAAVLDRYWDMGPSAGEVSLRITPPPTPFPQLKRLGPPPFDHLDLIELLAPIYETVTAQAMAWAFQNPEKTP